MRENLLEFDARVAAAASAARQNKAAR